MYTCNTTLQINQVRIDKIIKNVLQCKTFVLIIIQFVYCIIFFNVL